VHEALILVITPNLLKIAGNWPKMLKATMFALEKTLLADKWTP